jgi:hypothetical protein
VTQPARAEPRDAQASPQWGSGLAISVSVVIQSLGWVGRCLAGMNGSTASIA